MTDLQKTLDYLEDMGYNKLPYLPEDGEAGFRNYFHDRLYISCDMSSFTFNKDESLAGIGYGPPTYWLDDLMQSGREVHNFYGDEEDPFEEENRDPDEAFDWDAPITEDERKEMANWENNWEDN